MFETKLIEIRDRGTFIPAIATLIQPEHGDYLLRRAGFGYGERNVLLAKLDGGPLNYDPFAWPAPFNRTMKVAHEFLAACWDDIDSGAVVDVEFILGESDTIKRSEQEIATTMRDF